MGATTVAIIVAKERHIVDAYRAAGATTAARAVTPASLGVAERLAFVRLRDRAVLRETTPGTYYLDEPTWEALRAVRRRVVFIVLIIAVGIAVAGWIGVARA